MKPTSTGRPRLPEYMTVKELIHRNACGAEIEAFTAVFKTGRCRTTRRNLVRLCKVMGSQPIEWLLDTYHVPGGRRAEARARTAFWRAPDRSPEEIKAAVDAFGLS